jgi:tRNA(Ile)-lysidine synthase
MLRTIRDQALFDRGDQVLVAVSGGPDSTALLHGLMVVAPRLGLSVSVACVDHGLRPESADEAQSVADHCRGVGVRCEVVPVDVAKARRSHVSLQEAARMVRLAALQDIAKRLGCHKIALGHTADDQAETVLFRIVRGTGLGGLAGIPYRRDAFVRPLLDVRRAELLVYLAKRKLTFFSDPSNANRHYARSRIRHDVLPMLVRENPRVVEALLALSREAQGRGGRDWRTELPDGIYLSRRAAETVDRALGEGGTRQVAMKNGDLVVGYGRVVWHAKPAEPVPTACPGPVESILPDGGCFRLYQPPAPAVEVLPVCTGGCPTDNRACFDVAQLQWPLSLRPWRSGDRMAPRFGRGRRKLSDLLIDAKVPRRERATLPVLCDAADTILFVPGLRPSEAGRPNIDTQGWIEVRVAR